MWQETIIRRNQELQKRSEMRKHNRCTMNVYKVKISVPSDPSVWGASCRCLRVFKETKPFRDEGMRCVFNFATSLFQVVVSLRKLLILSKEGLKPKFIMISSLKIFIIS